MRVRVRVPALCSEGQEGTSQVRGVRVTALTLVLVWQVHGHSVLPSCVLGMVPSPKQWLVATVAVL